MERMFSKVLIGSWIFHAKSQKRKLNISLWRCFTPTQSQCLRNRPTQKSANASPILFPYSKTQFHFLLENRKEWEKIKYKKITTVFFFLIAVSSKSWQGRPNRGWYIRRAPAELHETAELRQQTAKGVQQLHQVCSR